MVFMDVDMGTDPHQVLADTFILFRSGPADYFYHIHLPLPCFEWCLVFNIFLQGIRLF